MFLLGGSLIFKLFYPHELCIKGLTGLSAGSHVLGGYSSAISSSGWCGGRWSDKQNYSSSLRL